MSAGAASAVRGALPAMIAPVPCRGHIQGGTSMKKQNINTLTAAGAAAFSLLAAPVVSEPVKWDFSDEYGSSEAHTTYRASQFCIGEVEKLAGGQLDITYHGGGVLGFKSADHFDAVQDGSVQGAITLLTQLGGIDPLFNLSSLPFLANTHEQAYELWRLARPEYEKVFADTINRTWATVYQRK